MKDIHKLGWNLLNTSHFNSKDAEFSQWMDKRANSVINVTSLIVLKGHCKHFWLYILLHENSKLSYCELAFVGFYFGAEHFRLFDCLEVKMS